MKMTKLKQIPTITAVSIGLLMGYTTPAPAGGIPVFDGASVAQAIQQGIKMKTQIDNQLKQLKELKDQIKALTRTRNLGEFAKNAALDQVPDEWKGIYDSVKSLDTKTLTGKGRYKSSNSVDALIDSYKTAAKAVQDSSDRFKVIEQLARKINETQDAKAAADLQNRISVEQSRIATTQVMLDMTMKMADQQEKIQAEQQRTIIKCQIKASSKAERKECGSISI